MVYRSCPKVVKNIHVRIIVVKYFFIKICVRFQAYYFLNIAVTNGMPPVDIAYLKKNMYCINGHFSLGLRY
jgi:hypothetical protein